MRERSIVAMFQTTWDRWNAHGAPRMAAALAYYTILSLAPLVVLVVAVAAMVFGPKMAQARTIDEVHRLLGGQAGNIIAGLIGSASHQARNFIAGLIAMIFALLGASSVFLELRSALNVIWGVQERAATWYTGLIKERLFAFVMVLSLGLLMVASLGCTLAISIVERYAFGVLPFSGHALRILNDTVAFALTWLVFTLIFRFVPETRIQWRDAAFGALATAILFEAVRLLLDVYLSHASVGSGYGAAGSLVVFLFWIYCSAQMFYMGAEFTRAWAEHFGGGMTEAEAERGGHPQAHPQVAH